jgi:hypothetical protein
MFTADPQDALLLAHERRDRLHAEAAAERFRAHSPKRRALAAVLRRAANRLDPAPLAKTATSQ